MKNIFILLFIFMSVSLYSQKTTIECKVNEPIDKKLNCHDCGNKNEIFSGILITKNGRTKKIYSPFKVKFLSSRKVNILDAYGNKHEINVRTINDYNTKESLIAYLQTCYPGAGGGNTIGEVLTTGNDAVGLDIDNVGNITVDSIFGDGSNLTGLVKNYHGTYLAVEDAIGTGEEKGDYIIVSDPATLPGFTFAVGSHNIYNNPSTFGTMTHVESPIEVYNNTVDGMAGTVNFGYFGVWNDPNIDVYMEQNGSVSLSFSGIAKSGYDGTVNGTLFTPETELDPTNESFYYYGDTKWNKIGGGLLPDGDYGQMLVQSDGTQIVHKDGQITAAYLATNIISQSKMAINSIGPDELINTGITAGEYTNPTITFDLDGRATAVSNGAGGGSSTFKGVHESLDSANINGVTNTEGDYVIIYEIGTYSFEEGDIVIFYQDPSTLGDSINPLYSNVGMYSTTGLGIAGTSPGEYFHTTGDNGLTFTGYINSSGSPFATGYTGNVSPDYDASNSGALLVPNSATKTSYNIATFHKGEYKYNSSGYKGEFESLVDANNNGVKNTEGDYVSIIVEGSGFTLSEGDLFTVYQNPSTNGTTLDATFNNRPMYSSTTVGQANTNSSDYYMVYNTETTATAYQNFGSANFVANMTIGLVYDAGVNQKLAIPQSGLNVGADFGLATFINGEYDFIKPLKLTEAKRDILTPVDGMEIYCSDCLDSGGVNAGVKQVYQLSTTTWKNQY